MRMAEKCAKTSGPPPSGSMKPNPLALLNHLTVPIGMYASLRSCLELGCLALLANRKFFAGVPKRVKTVRPREAVRGFHQQRADKQAAACRYFHGLTAGTAPQHDGLDTPKRPTR